MQQQQGGQPPCPTTTTTTTQQQPAVVARVDDVLAHQRWNDPQCVPHAALGVAEAAFAAGST
jgi:hypothetical protein